MDFASCSCTPVGFVLDARSDPARSTQVRRATVFVGNSSVDDRSTIIVKIVWLRLDTCGGGAGGCETEDVRQKISETNCIRAYNSIKQQNTRSGTDIYSTAVGRNNVNTNTHQTILHHKATQTLGSP